MNIAFVDVSGVLETSRSKNHQTLDSEAVARLLQFVQKHNMKIVITSNHRIGKTVRELNQMFHPIPVFDKTPIIPYAERGDEIHEWLQNAWLKHEEHVETFVIFDDDEDMGDLNHRLARCQYAFGIDDHVVEYAECLVVLSRLC